MPSNDLCLMSATNLLAAYAARKVSPVEVMTAVLARSEALNPKINALFHLVGESALAQARASEARWNSGQPKGVLDGVPRHGQRQHRDGGHALLARDQGQHEQAVSGL